MRTHIIYIPGLGDQYGWFRAWALMWWRIWGVTVHHQPINWYDGADLATKLKLITNAVDRAPSNSRIVLVGESAGATLALHMTANDTRIDRVVTLCGVARPDTPIAAQLRRRAPALHQAVQTLPTVFQIEIHSVRAAIDGVVGKRYSSTQDSIRHVIWSIGHMTTIVLSLTVLAPIITAIAKKQ